jgi:hypothetical protein
MIQERVLYMLNKLNFVFLLLYKYKHKHIHIFIISTLVISILSSVLFVSNSIEKELQNSLKDQADFTIQRFKAGKVLNTPAIWIDQFLKIDGVTNAQGRIYGMHYYEPLERYFMVVGLDMYDTQIVKSMQKLINNLDIEKF